MLGREFLNYYKNSLNQIIPLLRIDADITDKKIVLSAIGANRPDIIINCSALINVDYCEENPTETWLVNAIGPGNILAALNKLNLSKTVFLQISTSDVFGQNDKIEFDEDDAPSPVNVYGWSKLGGEKLTETEAKINDIKYYIIRTSWLYSEYRNTFVDYITDALKNNREIKIISDQFNTITWTKDLVAACDLLLSNDKYQSGIYHLASKSEKKTSKYDIALKIAKLMNLDKNYLKMGHKADIFKCDRPNAAILTSKKKISMPDWEESLQKYLKIKYGN